VPPAYANPCDDDPLRSIVTGHLTTVGAARRVSPDDSEEEDNVGSLPNRATRTRFCTEEDGFGDALLRRLEKVSAYGVTNTIEPLRTPSSSGSTWANTPISESRRSSVSRASRPTSQSSRSQCSSCKGMRTRRKGPRSLLSLVLDQMGLGGEADSIDSEAAEVDGSNRDKVARGPKAAVPNQAKCSVSASAVRADFIPHLVSLRRCASAPNVTYPSAYSSLAEEFTGADAVVAAKRSAAIAAFGRARGVDALPEARATGRIRPGSASCSASNTFNYISSCRSFVAPEGPRRRRCVVALSSTTSMPPPCALHEC